MAFFWFVLGAAIVVLLGVFAAYNPQPADIFMPGGDLQRIPIWTVAVVPALAGLVLGWLLTLADRIRSRWAYRRAMAQIAERDAAINQLQARVRDLERDLALAQRAAPPAVPPEGQLHAA